MAPTLYEKWFQTNFFFFFLKKLNISCSTNHTFLFKFHQHVVQMLTKECMKRLQTSNVSISNGNTKDF